MGLTRIRQSPWGVALLTVLVTVAVVALALHGHSSQESSDNCPVCMGRQEGAVAVIAPVVTLVLPVELTVAVLSYTPIVRGVVIAAPSGRAPPAATA